MLEIVEVPRPEHGPQEILVRNFAAGLNRADLLQRRGLYPPPEGVTDIIGLEFAGEVAELGAEVRGFRRGDRVFGLTAGGAYAEFIAIDSRMALPIPDSFSFDAAAAVPEAFITAGESLFVLGDLRPGQTVLVHAGASGVGTAAIQLARAAGAVVLATAGSPEKLKRLVELGATRAVNHRDDDFVEAARQLTAGRGVDLIVDLVGAKYWGKNLGSIAPGGRWIVVGLLGGSKVEVDLGQLLRRRLHLVGTSLRARAPEEKLAVIERFARTILPLLEAGTVRPVIDSVYPFEDVRAAHERMEANRNIGKIVLRL